MNKKDIVFYMLLIIGLFFGGFFSGNEWNKSRWYERWEFLEVVADSWDAWGSENKEGLKNLEKLNDEVDNLTYECDTWRKIAFENRAAKTGDFYIVWKDPNEVAR